MTYFDSYMVQWPNYKNSSNLIFVINLILIEKTSTSQYKNDLICHISLTSVT